MQAGSKEVRYMQAGRQPSVAEVVNECIHVWTADRMLCNKCFRQKDANNNGFDLPIYEPFYTLHTCCLVLNNIRTSRVRISQELYPTMII
jgi:uncharacterized radical SAM superfamily Fe-S cluster-containing enzyme